MAEMTDAELRSLVEQEFTTATGGNSGEIATERAKAWDYYMSKALGNEVEGLSQVVTSDVADVVDGIMPSLLRIFTTADNLVSFDPTGMEDEERAAQESDYVNHVFFKRNPSFMLMFAWFFDALVQKVGYTMASWDEAETVSQESYEGLSGEELLELMEDEDLEPVESAEREAETVAEDGQTIVREIVHDVTFRRVNKRGRVRVENVPPEEMRISKDVRSVDLSDGRMVGRERDDLTRSDLLAMGFDEDIVDGLPAVGDLPDTPEKNARRDKADESGDVPRDRSQERILVREAYIRCDYDGDGRAELRQVFTAGNEILSNEIVDRRPFHAICPHPLPHKHFGRATAEKVMDLQETTSTLTRQILDNLYHTNNPSHAVWEQGMGDDTLDDLLTTRVGSIKRFARPVAESYQPISIPFTAGHTFQMLGHYDKVKRDRTGVSADSEGLSPDALKNIQQSVLMQAADLSKQKIEAIARIFAETGIKSLFRHIHELVQKHQQKPEMVRLRNKWVQVDPQQWRTREDMTVNIGLGIGTREQNLLHLEAIWRKQKDLAALGDQAAVLLQPRNVFNTAAEIVKNANLKNPEMFFTDPGDEPFQANQNDPGSELAMAQLRVQERQQQLDLIGHRLKAQSMLLDHQRRTRELDLKEEQHDDDVVLQLEKIATDLTELDLKYGENVPGSKV